MYGILSVFSRFNGKNRITSDYGRCYGTNKKYARCYCPMLCCEHEARKNVRSADKSMLFCFRPVYKVVEKGVNSKPGYGLYACFAGYVLAVRYDGVYRYIVALGYFFVCVSVGKACEYFLFSGREFGVVVSVFFINRVPVPEAR